MFSDCLKPMMRFSRKQPITKNEEEGEFTPIVVLTMHLSFSFVPSKQWRASYI